MAPMYYGCMSICVKATSQAFWADLQHMRQAQAYTFVHYSPQAVYIGMHTPLQQQAARM